MRQPLPAQASPAQAVVRAVEMVAAQPKVERVARAAVAMAVGQMETQEQPEQLTRAAAAARVGFKHLRITRAKLAVQASSSSKCLILLPLLFPAV